LSAVAAAVDSTPAVVAVVVASFIRVRIRPLRHPKYLFALVEVDLAHKVDLFQMKLTLETLERVANNLFLAR
jgi:hypothetical protein